MQKIQGPYSKDENVISLQRPFRDRDIVAYRGAILNQKGCPMEDDIVAHRVAVYDQKVGYLLGFIRF